MEQPEVKIMRLAHGEGIELPFYASNHAAGADLRAAIDEEIVIAPGQYRLIRTGFAMALPENYEAQIRPRSGLALKYGITVLNSPGTIDADYRGEVGVILINHGTAAFTVCRGDRIAQMVIAPFSRAAFQTVSALSDTDRGSGGFGSSGIQ
ncbi:dUTP diphosphatase [Mariprofundus erugo]|uniref:dUTP diphosphatase n=1 Tax=Mariprofundus erugo TaxID=2528639 RepID=UPI0010FF299B|nr:dUTP diphosphatase [Mariprofundus erugo]TLS77836.1 dUTP diphosphatase [Mariprofundus erugo]